MTKRKVQLFGQSRGIEIDTAATEGAVVGVNLRWPNGQLVTEDDFGGSEVEDPGATYWRTIMEIPPNVSALADMADAGIYVITGPGQSEARKIHLADGELVGANLDGVAGDPSIGLADVADAGGGELQKTAFDSKGRKTGTSAASTDDLPEGVTNAYFTEERAQDAVGSILDGTGDIGLEYDAVSREISASLNNPNLLSIGATVPTDGDILEYDAAAEEWRSRKDPRELYLDGGNF